MASPKYLQSLSSSLLLDQGVELQVGAGDVGLSRRRSPRVKTPRLGSCQLSDVYLLLTRLLLKSAVCWCSLEHIVSQIGF